MEKKKKWMYVAFEQSLIFTTNLRKYKAKKNPQMLYTNPGGERLNPQPYLN